MHASVVSIASVIFATVFPTPELIFMNISEWCNRSCKLQNSQLPMRRCAILCWQFQQRFRMIQFWILMKKFKKKKITVRPDKTVDRMRASKQFGGGGLLSGELRKYAKNSNLENFQNALYSTSVSMPLRTSCKKSNARKHRISCHN